VIRDSYRRRAINSLSVSEGIVESRLATNGNPSISLRPGGIS